MRCEIDVALDELECVFMLLEEEVYAYSRLHYITFNNKKAQYMIIRICHSHFYSVRCLMYERMWIISLGSKSHQESH